MLFEARTQSALSPSSLTSLALSRHNRSGPKSSIRGAHWPWQRTGWAVGMCSGERLEERGRRHSSKRMVTCDRHCEPRSLSMPCGYALFYCDETVSPALTAASADVSSSGQGLKTDSHPLNPGGVRTPPRVPLTPRPQTWLLLRCFKVHRDEPLCNGATLSLQALYAFLCENW